MWRRAKELAPVKVMLHSCGGIRELLPDLIDAGLDTVNPVQITCAGMDAAGLKKDFGRDIVFWGGGCDTREVLPYGTPASIRDHVRRQVDILAKGGGLRVPAGPQHPGERASAERRRDVRRSAIGGGCRASTSGRGLRSA